MKKQINWYIEAIERILIEQRCEIDELEAEIAYLESSPRKSKATYKMIAKLKQQLAEAMDNLENGMRYAESQLQYA